MIRKLLVVRTFARRVRQTKHFCSISDLSIFAAVYQAHRFSASLGTSTSIHLQNAKTNGYAFTVHPLRTIEIVAKNPSRCAKADTTFALFW